jgi:hypothetical protein
MNPYQSSFSRTPPAWNRFRIVPTGTAEDARIVEEAAEQEEGQVEGDREADQECAGRPIDAQVVCALDGRPVQASEAGADAKASSASRRLIRRLSQ